MLETGGQTCTVVALINYLKVRAQGLDQGQFLVHFDSKPPTRYQVSAILANSLQFYEGKIGRLRPHSFVLGLQQKQQWGGIRDQVI